MKAFIHSALAVVALAFTATNVNAQPGRSRHYHYYAPPPRVVVRPVAVVRPPLVVRPFYGQRVVRIGGPHVMVPYAGINYYYSSGFFYRPYASYFQVVVPPVGIHIGVLPVGYRTVYVSGLPYYYANGTYYRSRPTNNDYEVINAPEGASVPELPTGAKAVVINNQKFYELNGTYYKEDIRGNSEIWYTVVGKNGVLNTAPEPQPTPVQPQQPATPVVGQVYNQLPEGCKTVVIAGKRYYAAPDDTYYEEVINNNVIQYKVTGKAAQ